QTLWPCPVCNRHYAVSELRKIFEHRGPAPALRCDAKARVGRNRGAYCAISLPSPWGAAIRSQALAIASYVSRAALLFPPGDSHRPRIDRDLETRQEAHSQQSIDAFAITAFGIVLDHDGDVLGRQRAQLNGRGASSLGSCKPVGRMHGDDAVVV